MGAAPDLSEPQAFKTFFANDDRLDIHFSSNIFFYLHHVKVLMFDTNSQSESNTL